MTNKFAKLATMTEKELRDYKLESIESKEDLDDLLEVFLTRDQGYGTCVHTMSLAAQAAYELLASKLGVSGFQGSCAELDFLRRTRDYDAPFMIVSLHNMLYPQYDHPVCDVYEFIERNEQWLKESAVKKLQEILINGYDWVNPVVAQHWRDLAGIDERTKEGWLELAGKHRTLEAWFLFDRKSEEKNHE